MRRLSAAISFVLAVCSMPSEAANTWGTDLSDMWWNPNESGWGANIAHQGEIVFLTLYVYGADGKVKWYVGPSLASLGGNSTFTFSGALYETTGPYLAGTFNPANVGIRQVGNATINFDGVDHATLIYGVDGANVSKSLERQTFRSNNLSGSYTGAAIYTTTGCGANSGSYSNYSQFVVNQTGTSVSIAASISNGIGCTYSGTYTQTGRMGGIVGTLSCTNGGRGTYRAFEIEASYQGFFLRYNADYGGGCTETGRVGGMK